MTIYFSPEYSGQIFIRPSEGDVMMDAVVVNTIGLVNLLELRLGLHYEDMPEQQRTARYYEAMSIYIQSNPDDILAESFRTSGLSTAKAVLSWRDELRMAQWDFDGADISRRLNSIIGIEEIFRKESGCDLAGRIHIVTDQVCSQKLDCRDMKLVVPVETSLLKPAVGTLVDVLCEYGASVSILPKAETGNNNLNTVRELLTEGIGKDIILDPKDESFLIWSFPDEHKAGEYLAAKGDDIADVWINADNKQMDNWLSLMGKEVSGSSMGKCSPQVTQLFIMGLGLFSSPLNVNTLIEWLNMPVHPIDGYSRGKLAETIVSEGGYRNDACRETVRRYIDGEFIFLDEEQRKLPEDEQKKLRQKDLKKRRRNAEVFLPPFESAGGDIRTEALKTFLSELASWARQRAHVISEEDGNIMWVEQLCSVAEMSDALLILVGTVKTGTMDFKTLDSWVSSIYRKVQFTHTVAEAGSRDTVDSPAKVISVAQRTIWLGVEGDSPSPLECSFLYPTEKEALAGERLINPWKKENENRYNQANLYNPLLRTSGQLILVICERRSGALTEKHPMIVRLEQQVKNLDAVIRYPKLKAKELREVMEVDNGGVAAEISFAGAEHIRWPDHMSPTSIGTLAEYPFDYLMERLLHIETDENAQMADVKTTMGNVAHAVIEALFSPGKDSRTASPEEIKSRIATGFEKTYARTVEAKGAVLLLAENKLKEKLLHEQLGHCLDILVEILMDNRLKVTGCERYVEEDMGLGLPQKTDSNGNILKRDILGYIDMTLEDECGHPVVFDFKWTSSKNYYQGLLTENRSVQLELYRHMLTRCAKDNVERVAYFLMPAGRLYSKEHFNGRHCIHLDPANTDNIVEKLRNSIIYRKHQIDSGVIETNGGFDFLQYVKDTEAMNLFPLRKDEELGIKQENDFSNYKLFNS